MNKKNLIAVFGLVLVLVLVLFFTMRNASGSVQAQSIKKTNKTTNKCVRIVGNAEVSLDDTHFDPPEITVPVCTKVTFKNVGTVAHWPASDLHPTHGIYPEFDPLRGIDPGSSWSFVFDRVGRWRDHDHLNPVVVGVINVTQ